MYLRALAKSIILYFFFVPNRSCPCTLSKSQIMFIVRTFTATCIAIHNPRVCEQVQSRLFRSYQKTLSKVFRNYQATLKSFHRMRVTRIVFCFVGHQQRRQVLPWSAFSHSKTFNGPLKPKKTKGPPSQTLITGRL